MSYLLDALRKADQERQLGTVPDLTTVTDTNGAPRPGAPIWLACLIVAVITLNVAVLGAVLWPWAGSLEPTGALPAISQHGPTSQQRSPGSRLPAGDVGVAPISDGTQLVGRPSAGQSTQGVSSPSGVDGRFTAVDGASGEQPSPAADSREPVLAAEPERLDQTESGANVTPASASLIESFDAVPLLRSLPTSVRHDLPDYTINGLLYSRQPALSFVLINSGRYHEGERIPGAGAVVTITADSVVINYQGLRFRLRAPH